MADKSLITVLIEVRNEQIHIAECIESAHLLTDAIIVVDQESSDGSAQIAASSAATVYQHAPVKVVEEVRAFGIAKVETPWVFILDADERMTESLAEEINSVIRTQENSCSHYKVPRRNLFGGTTWLRHGGWWPDMQLRLIAKHAFRKWPEAIHSTPEIEGMTGFLTQPILHYFHGDISAMVKKTAQFEQVEADLLYRAGRKSGSLTFMRKYTGELTRRLLKKAGFMDGPIGIIESVYQAYSKTITYLFLYEKQNSGTV